MRNSGEIGAGLSTDCDTNIENSAFSNNSARSGGAIYFGHAFYGNPFLPQEPALQTIALHSVKFTSNVAQNGGAIAVQAGPARRAITVRHGNFNANGAGSGGGIDLGVRALLPGSPGVRDIDLNGNALVFLQNEAATDGGGIKAGFATVEIVRGNLAENSAGRSGGAMYIGEQFSGKCCKIETEGGKNR